MKVNCCKHLDYENNYTNCTKQVLASVQGEQKVFWMREVSDPDLPKMVQFCKLRGRLNHPEACVTHSLAMCSEYEEVEHEIPDEEII